MNELTLHYVTQADRERTIESDLRNRQILEAAAQATASIERAAAASRNAPVAPRPTTVRARAAGR
jgi:hypothetical protein